MKLRGPLPNGRYAGFSSALLRGARGTMAPGTAPGAYFLPSEKTLAAAASLSCAGFARIAASPFAR
jgi:hypothetical protein